MKKFLLAFPESLAFSVADSWSSWHHGRGGLQRSEWRSGWRAVEVAAMALPIGLAMMLAVDWPI